VSLWVPAREPSAELLDAGVPHEEAKKSLADIEWVHRRLGGRGLVRRGLLPLVGGLGIRGEARLLDLGCGSGHVGRDIEGQLAARGRAASVAGLDRQVGHARFAPRGRAVAGDPARLPLAAGSFDVVFSTRTPVQ